MPARLSVRCSAKLALLFLLFTALASFAQRPVGVDVSSYQGASINWATAKANGISFAWAKATEGLTVNDADFTINMANAKAAGVLIGAYHFAHPELHTPADEAAHFWSVAGSYIKNGGFYLMPMLDYERFTNGVVGATSHSDWSIQWNTIISNNAAANGVLIKPIVYVSACNACYYDSSVSSAIPWIADYNGQNAQTSTPWTACTSCERWGAGAWTLWQNTDSAPLAGATQNADGDVFNGTMAQLITKLVIGSSVINSQPSSRYADRGSSLIMRVGVTTTNGATYQWRFNGTSISGSTKSTLTLTNIQSTNAGSYTVVAVTSLGTATSSNAVLTVNQSYTPVFSDDFDVSSAANWTLNKSSTDTRVTFAYDYSTIGIPAAPNSVNATTKGLRLEANLTKTNIAAVSVSPKNQAFSGNYRLHFDMWINVNGPLQGPDTGGGGGSTEALTAGVGTLGNRTEWNGNGSTADGVYFFVDGEGDVSDTSATTGDFGAYTGTTFLAVSNGVYTAGTQAAANQTSDGYYQNVFPGSQAAPALQQSTYPQQTGTLAAGTVGLGWHDVVINKGASTVDWFIDGLKIASVSSASIIASNIFVGYWDPFSSLSDNTNLSFGLIDNLRVEIPAVAPDITGQPSSQTVVLSSNTTFNVAASGTPAPNFQWRFNNAPIANATASSYTIVNAQTTNAGSYSVILSNVAGSVTSSSVVLTVLVPPTLTSQPHSQTANVGANANFAFTCTGSQPLIFQWTKNNGIISGATADQLTLTNVQFADAGTYVGTVFNSAGTNSTSNAVLSVVQMQTSSPTVTPDGLFQFTINGAPGPGYIVEGSSNLIDWLQIAVLTNDTGTAQFNDSASTNYPQFFYRVSAPK